MLDVEKFLVALRSNKDVDGKLKPIHLADTVQEEIKIIQAAVENSRREWVGLTEKEIHQAFCHVEYETPNDWNKDPESWCIANAKYLQAILKEKNHEQP